MAAGEDHPPAGGQDGPYLHLSWLQAADAVAAVLAEGLAQDGAVYAFMESAFGCSGVQAFEDILAQGDTSDALTLRSLLLTPGPAVLVALEPSLEAARCTTVEAQAVAARLAGTCRETQAVLPAIASPGNVRVLIPLEPDDVRVFVRKLRLESTPPSEISALLDQCFSPEDALPLKVLLRHCRLEWTPSRVALLSTLLSRLPYGVPRDANPDAQKILAWAVRFLDVAGPLVLARPALTRRYRELSIQLGQAEQFAQALAASSYEIMMSQGMRGSHLHAETLREELALLDRACRAVLGIPAAFLDSPIEANLGVYDDAEVLMAALTGLDALGR